MLPVSARKESSISARVRYADPDAIRHAVLVYAAEVRATHPEVRAIRWFGSWVQGTAAVGSDVDLCILVDRSDKPRRHRVPDFLPRSFPVGIDLFVYTLSEYDALASEHPSLLRAFEAGIEV